MKIYIAGPMTGLKDFNYPAFNKASELLRGKGHEIENPAENPKPECNSWSGYMRMSIVQIVKCDGVALLPGWWRSKGATTECFIAWRLGMKIFKISDITQ
jgi:hypothetical protein